MFARRTIFNICCISVRVLAIPVVFLTCVIYGHLRPFSCFINEHEVCDMTTYIYDITVDQVTFKINPTGKLQPEICALDH